MSKPTIFTISASWDSEASVWTGHCDDIPAAADAATLDELLAKITDMALDQKMLKIKDKIILLEQALADHTIYAQEPKKAADFARLKSRFESELEREETHWLELHEGTLNA